VSSWAVVVPHEGELCRMKWVARGIKKKMEWAGQGKKSGPEVGCG
jgi:hypothetical protein